MSKVDKNKMYQVPEGYFDDMTGKVLSQVNLPSKQQSPFEVPQDYFSGLQEKVVEKVQPTKVRNIASRRWMSVAASFALLICASLYVWTFESTSEAVLADISASESIGYLEAVDEQLSLKDLAAFMDEEDIEALTEEVSEGYIEILDEVELIELEELL